MESYNNIVEPYNYNDDNDDTCFYILLWTFLKAHSANNYQNHRALSLSSMNARFDACDLRSIPASWLVGKKKRKIQISGLHGSNS